MTAPELADWEATITGWIVAGDYQKAAEIAHEHGVEGVLWAMNRAMRDGHNEALKHIAYFVTDELKRLHGR